MSSLSHADRGTRRTWTLSIAGALLTFAHLLVFSVAAHFPNAGLPCYYPRIIDFDSLNLSQYNAAHHLTPQLYLDATQLLLYVVLTEAVFAVVIVYYLVCWWRVCRRRDHGPQLNQTTRDIDYLGDSATCFVLVLCLDAFELYLLSLSFRLPSLVAFAQSLYFGALTAFAVMLVTRYESQERDAFAFSRLHPSLRGATVQYRTAVVNLVELLLGVGTMTFALSLALAFGNSFFVRAGHVVFGALGVFLLVAVAYFAVLETVLARYAKVQFGYYAGAILGVCGASYPIFRYETLSASEFARDINGTLVACLLICVAGGVTRIVRFFARRQRRYRPLAAREEEIRALRQDAD